jgi:hypothetical protein
MHEALTPYVLAEPHGVCVDVEDVDPSLLLGQSDLHLHLKTTRSQKGVIDHIFPVRHPWTMTFYSNNAVNEYLLPQQKG